MNIPAEVVALLESIRVKPGRIGEHSWVMVERRDGFKGTRWAVTDMGICLNRLTGAWDYEPIPSSRTDAWLEQHRYQTFDEAWRAAAECRLNPGLS